MNTEQMRIVEFENWWEQFKSEHEEWKWVDKEALLYQAWEAALRTQAKVEPDFNESLYEWRWYTIDPRGLKYSITAYYQTAEEAQAAKGFGEGWSVERIESTKRPVRRRNHEQTQKRRRVHLKGQPEMTEFGMTLRDWFAGRVCAALMTMTSADTDFPNLDYQRHPGGLPYAERVACISYQMADAMLKARETCND